MTKLEDLQAQIGRLSPEELTAFRRWFLDYDWQLWDRELEEDVADGKLDKFGAEALENLKRGDTKKI